MLHHHSEKKRKEEEQKKKQVEEVVEKCLKEQEANVQSMLHEDVIKQVNEHIESLRADFNEQFESMQEKMKKYIASSMKEMASDLASAFEKKAKKMEGEGNALLAALQAKLEESHGTAAADLASIHEVKRKSEEEVANLMNHLQEQEQLWNQSVSIILHSINQSIEKALQVVPSEYEKHGADGLEPTPPDRVVLNVGGTRFETYRETLRTFPDTLLGAMFSERNAELLPHTREFFFDRDPRLFPYILAAYRTEKLVRPDGINYETWNEELDFWNMPETSESDICPSRDIDVNLMEKFSRFLTDRVDRFRTGKRPTLLEDARESFGLGYFKMKKLSAWQSRMLFHFLKASEWKGAFLYLRRAIIDEQSAEALATLLKSTTNLQKLILYDCDLRAKGCLDILSRGLKENTSLKELYVNFPAIKHYFAGNYSPCFDTHIDSEFGDKLAACIANGIPASCSRISLSSCGMTNIGAKAIAEALLGAKQELSAIYLSGNNIGDAGAIALVQACKTRQLSKELDLDLNNISDTGAMALLEAMRAKGLFILHLCTMGHNSDIAVPISSFTLHEIVHSQVPIVFQHKKEYRFSAWCVFPYLGYF